MATNRSRRRYKKMVLPVGYYKVNTIDPVTGKKKQEIQYFSEERLKSWGEKVDRMNAKGLNIPTPYEHTPRAVPFDDATAERVKDTLGNGGFWKKAEWDAKKKGLVAVIQPATKEDAENLNTKVKGVSIAVLPSYTDPFGEEWKDVPVHLALTNRPMTVDSSKFEKVKDEPAIAMSAITMSDMVSDGAADLGSVKDLLKRVAKVALPDGTTIESLLTNLTAALLQKQLSESGAGSVDLTVPPPGGEVSPGPVIMSENNMSDELKAQVEDLTARLSTLQEENGFLKGRLLNERKTALKERAKGLLASEIIDQEYHDGVLIKEIELVDSLDPAGVDARIEALEAAKKPAPRTPSQGTSGQVFMSQTDPVGSVQVDNELAYAGQMTDERLDEVVAEMLKSSYTFAGGE